jgi:tetratricopeptide (TPR) repeat protein
MDEQMNDDRQPRGPGEGTFWNRTVPCLGVILLVAWPLLSYGVVDAERGRWKHASARVAWDQGDREKALEAIDQAVELDPGNVAALVDRARWLGELGKYEQGSLDLEAAAGLAGNLEEEIQYRQQLCDSLLHLQQPDAVIRQWDLIDQAIEGQGGQQSWPLQQQVLLLNNRAYQVALTGWQPVRVVEEADKAIELLGGEGIAWDDKGAPFYLAACQSYLEKSYVQALEFSSQATHHASRFLDRWTKQYEPRVNWKASERKRRDEHLETLRRYVARVYKLHAKVLEKTGQQQKRDEALAMIPRLGQDPEQLEAVIARVDEIRVLMSLQGISNLRATVLDTRGYALLKNQQPNLALMDLRVAARLCDKEYHTMIVSIDRQRKLAVDPAPLDRYARQMTRQLAVLLYHRSLVFDAVHQPARAREDRERIKEQLKLHPDQHLF